MTLYIANYHECNKYFYASAAIVDYDIGLVDKQYKIIMFFNNYLHHNLNLDAQDLLYEYLGLTINYRTLICRCGYSVIINVNKKEYDLYNEKFDNNKKIYACTTNAKFIYKNIVYMTNYHISRDIKILSAYDSNYNLVSTSDIGFLCDLIFVLEDL